MPSAPGLLPVCSISFGGGDATNSPPAMTIREIVKHGRPAYELDAGVVEGRRRRFFFRTKKDAEKKLAGMEMDRKAVGETWAELPSRDRAETVRVLTEMQAAGVTLAGVWQAYQTGQAGKAVVSRAVGDVIKELLAAKRQAKRRESYLVNLQVHLDDFATGREGIAIASVGLREVESYLAGAKSAGSRMTRLNRLSTLLSFAVRRGYITANPCKLVEKVATEWRAPDILTVRQCRDLLDAARKLDRRFLPHLALCLFAGVRPAEARRLAWADVDLKTGLLTIDAEDSKTRSRRIVELPKVCVAWLHLGGDLPAASVRYRLAAVAKAAGIAPWPRDGLRHSAASYWHALKGEVVTARNLGHSEAVLHHHYRALVSPAEARKFFALWPT